MHADLIGTYSKYVRQQQPVVAIISNNVSLTCMTMINPATGWFGIVEILMYKLNEVIGGNDEYIDKFIAGFIPLFNNTWLCRYLDPRKVIIDKLILV